MNKPHTVLQDYIDCPKPLAERSTFVKGDEVIGLQGRSLKPAYENQSEKPEHRIVAYLKAQGLSDIEVAERTGLHSVTIGYLKKQPWMEELILLEIQKAGREPVLQMLQGACSQAVQKVIDTMSNEKASPDVQRKAANDILDRVFGKSVQPYTSSKPPEQLTDDELRQQVQAALRGTGSKN